MIAAPISRPGIDHRVAGNGYIAGIAPGLVTVGGAPSARRVLLQDDLTRAIVASTMSKPDGTYRFDHLAPDRRYTVTGFDHNHVYNAVIRDNLTPAVEE